MSSLTFNSLVSLSSNGPGSGFGPRTAKLSIRNGEIAIDTPGILTCTSRGVVPHLSQDNVKRTVAIKWLHVPFESFLEHRPPVPTLQPQQSNTPRINTFLGISPSDHIVSMSLRDSNERREMPANTNTYVTANCIRGVRKVTPDDWRSYAISCNPDIVFALSDTPFTAPPYSQKRLTKSIERSASWLANMLRRSDLEAHPANVFVEMAGAGNISARTAFADSLLELLHDKDADVVRPLRTLDEGVAGYVFDLLPLGLALQASEDRPLDPSVISSLLRASLSPLPSLKPRLITGARGPHDILRLISDVGVDVFDTSFCQGAADVGVALDFSFPPADSPRRDLGYNLYDTKYREDFTTFTDDRRSPCGCAACSPTSAISEIICHSSVDGPTSDTTSPNQPYTRAFLHHLLHTHEMSAHSLLAMHNITIMNSFMAGIRAMISQNDVRLFESEVKRFFKIYIEDADGEMTHNVFSEAKRAWREVELLRGKGRLGRESEREKADAANAANAANALLKWEMEENIVEGGPEVAVPTLSGGENTIAL